MKNLFSPVLPPYADIIVYDRELYEDAKLTPPSSALKYELEGNPWVRVVGLYACPEKKEWYLICENSFYDKFLTKPFPVKKPLAFKTELVDLEVPYQW
jgi:hypothetical protein